MRPLTKARCKFFLCIAAFILLLSPLCIGGCSSSQSALPPTTAPTIEASPSMPPVMMFYADSTVWTLYHPAPVVPPFWWEATYAWVEKCSGLRGDFTRISFIVADSIYETSLKTSAQQAMHGLWIKFTSDKRIIAYDDSRVDKPSTVAHEMGHDVGLDHGVEHSKCLPKGER